MKTREAVEGIVGLVIVCAVVNAVWQNSGVKKLFTTEPASSIEQAHTPATLPADTGTLPKPNKKTLPDDWLDDIIPPQPRQVARQPAVQYVPVPVPVVLPVPSTPTADQLLQRQLRDLQDQMAQLEADAGAALMMQTANGFAQPAVTARTRYQQSEDERKQRQIEDRLWRLENGFTAP
jgi:hypothetical protein